jgi:short-subunit dehydrogenase involved in D-alanine esterification of teichoic acids
VIVLSQDYVSNEVFKAEINHIKKDIEEIKSDAKESNNHFREVIDVLKENSVRQTEILNNQMINQEKQFKQINDDISGLKVDLHTNISSQTKWYQDFLSDYTGKTMKILVVVILILAGAKLAGVDIMKLLTGSL